MSDNIAQTIAGLEAERQRLTAVSTIQQMSPSANGGSFWSNLSEGVPAHLLGIPFTEATSMTATATTGSYLLACVDLQDFIIADRLGTSVERHNVHGTSGGRSTGKWEFVARWRTSGDLVNANAGRVLKL
jgi:HK97 family phage major capsid protein